MLEAAVVYGYFPVREQGRRPDRPRTRTGRERARFTFPRQRRDRHLCLADFFRPQESGETDVRRLPARDDGPADRRGRPASCSPRDAYRDYLELHGLSVQLTEALAEYWHTRMRAELGFGDEDPERLEDFFNLGYRGARYSFGYRRVP